MIAWKRVAQLKGEIGEPDFSEIVTLFLEEVDDVINRLNPDAPPDELSADLHFLKGSALNLGFHGFASVCQEGENAAREGRSSAANVAQVIAVYKNSRQVFLRGLESTV